MEPTRVHFNWIFNEQVGVNTCVGEFETMFAEDEVAYSAYKTLSDFAIFTNKRIFIRDISKSILASKRLETHIIPYSSIEMLAFTNENETDPNDYVVSLMVWTRVGTCRLDFKCHFDLEVFNKVIGKSFM